MKLIGGNILTMRRPGETTDSIAWSGDRILDVGTAAAGDAGPVIDLKGRTVIPGLCDAHTHFWYWAITLDQVELDGVKSLEASLRRVADRVAQEPEGGWIVGRGFNQNLWDPPEFPTRYDLDRVAPGHAVALFSKDAHAIWANSLALERCGITRDVEPPPGGTIIRDDDGEPTGVFLEKAYELIERKIPLPKPRQEREALQRGAAILHRLGVTAVHDMGPWEAWLAYARWQERTLDLTGYLRLPKAEAAVEGGLKSGDGEPTLRVGGLKFFSDGALGSQTAYMFEPYEGTSDNHGVSRMSPAEISERLEYAEAHGLACAIHAIGDRANSEVIDGAVKFPARKYRHRIEHVQCARPEDVRRMAESGWVASVQPSHLVSDRDTARRNWGEGRSRNAYPFGGLARAGVPLAFGSDVPIEPVDPLLGIYAACCRRHPEDSRGPWEASQCIERYRALHASTAGAAYAAGQEGETGMLAPGMRANLVVLDRDILSVPDDEIREVKILATIHAGQPMYVDEEAAPDLCETFESVRV